MGDTVVPMLSGVAELVMRISIVLLLPLWIGEYGIYLAEEAAWIGATLLLGIMYYIRIGRLLKASPPKEESPLQSSAEQSLLPPSD